MNLKSFILSDHFLNSLGSVPMVVGSGSRIPQIMANFQQRHTGALSLVTWVMSLVGNIMRVLTTLAMVDDRVTLAGHIAALTTNVFLVVQIGIFWTRTKEVLAAEKAKVAAKKTQ